MACAGGVPGPAAWLDRGIGPADVRMRSRFTGPVPWVKDGGRRPRPGLVPSLRRRPDGAWSCCHAPPSCTSGARERCGGRLRGKVRELPRYDLGNWSAEASCRRSGCRWHVSRRPTRLPCDRTGGGMRHGEPARGLGRPRCSEGERRQAGGDVQGDAGEDPVMSVPWGQQRNMGQRNAPTPVMSRPTISVWMLSVPSKV
jgi:hypothetical protein